MFPKKDGSPNAKFYENPEIIAYFDPVRTWLSRNAKKYIQADPLTNKNLATLCMQMLQFQEESFGRSVKNAALPKLPMRCFMDFKPGSGLCQIFMSALKFRTDHSWRRFDFQSPNRRSQNVEMFLQIKRELTSSGLWTVPNVFIHTSVDRNLQSRVRDIVTKHQGGVTESETEATHILYPPPASSMDSTPDDDVVRVVFKESRGVMIHRCRLPDSFDLWQWGGAEPELNVEPQGRPEGPWEVDVRWVLDMEDNNEWMNEEDYLMAEQVYAAREGKRQVQPRPTMRFDDLMTELTVKREKKKRKRSPSPSSVSATAGSVISGSSSVERSTGAGNAATKRKSLRSPGAKKAKREVMDKDQIEDEDDLTRDMPDPEPPHRLTEVRVFLLS